MTSPTERFSNRVEKYAEYRPSYPAGVVDSLKSHCGLGRNSTVADVGSGTGIFTELLLQTGCRVFAVEPNQQMRLAAEDRLKPIPSFVSVAGSAERTGLASDSIDIITAAQSFHWFRTEETLNEFHRILKPHGWVALVWNQRKANSRFQVAYEQLLCRLIPEYEAHNNQRIDLTKINDFLNSEDFCCQTFDNCQYFDLDGIKGRTLSSSYTPLPGAPGHEELMSGLDRLFRQHSVGGQVPFEYETQLYLGTLRSRA